MDRTIWMACLLALASAVPALAQKKKKTAKPVPTVTAEQLIQSYRFDEAADLLQQEIKDAQKAGKGTERLETDMRRANLGADMLRGTERVTFVDSFKVGRTQVLGALRLSPDAGTVVATVSQAEKLRMPPACLGQTAFINDLGDRIVFAASSEEQGVKNILSAYRSGKGWGTPSVLEGLADAEIDQDNPFVMPDGVTLYYAAQGEGSLGGYDLFVTRYNPATKDFLRAENLGMPFNSPANDYMLVIDEAANLGWLVSDRFQSPDSACVYVFVPNETREVYEISDMNREHVLHVAQLHSIAETQEDTEAVKAARSRLAALSKARGATESRQSRYVINDHTVYTDLKQFRSEAARRIAAQVDETEQQIEALEQRQDDLQRAVAGGNRSEEVLNQLRQINQYLPQLRETYRTLCKNMRRAELK